ncbi:hypothetical protein SAMN04487895_11297 [Paenibacillus sophorae]|uniref:Uncharacterized protein n=1 Tax=Paenibacillus sophorae TaxID=1333845 RepID=A0A1H8STI6_9BACL|nr:hypothetical protein SAMN04487895_11297 [Paenibacillus sophorae]
MTKNQIVQIILAAVVSFALACIWAFIAYFSGLVLSIGEVFEKAGLIQFSLLL